MPKHFTIYNMNIKTGSFLFFSFLIFIFLKAQTSDNNLYNLFLHKQYEKVIETIEGSDNLSATDCYYAGLSAEILEDTPLATFYFKQSIALDSTFVPAKISLAQSLFQNEEFADAIEIYVNLLETDTLNAFLWSNLGDCYAKLMLIPLAYSSYQSAFYINPKNSSNTLKLVSALSALKTKDYLEESLFYCDSSLLYNENHKPLLRRKATLLFTNKEFIRAAPVLEYLMSQRDSSFLVIKYAGICHALFKHYDAAIFLLRKAHKQTPADMEVMLHLASSLSNKPELFDEAVEMIYKIRKNIEPDSAIIYQTNTLLAQSYLSIKDTVNAILQYYYSMNIENKEDRLLRMTSLANNVAPKTPHSLLWYVHYYFLQNFKPEYERNWNFVRQKSFSVFLLEEYMKYMHLSGQKKVKWETFDKKTKVITMKDLQQF
ncbi:MAG: hypothetical protein FWD09_03255 [Lentimicrobiaceae bacterium]|nr:hypothetical protein [Lentimicrobiaceae bacterium]